VSPKIHTLCSISGSILATKTAQKLVEKRTEHKAQKEMAKRHSRGPSAGHRPRAVSHLQRLKQASLNGNPPQSFGKKNVFETKMLVLKQNPFLTQQHMFAAKTFV